jgi:WD40 repeat protein
MRDIGQKPYCPRLVLSGGVPASASLLPLKGETPAIVPPAGGITWLLPVCVLAVIASPLCGQAIREISSSRVIEVTPALREGHQPPVITGVAVQPNGDQVATVGDDHIVRLWSMTEGRLLRRLATHVDWVRCAAFSPDGRVLATAGHDGLVVFWNPETGASLRTLAVPQAVSTLVYSRDGKLLAMAGFGSQLWVYDTATGTVAHQFSCPCHDLRCVAFSPRGNQIAAAGRDGRVHVWRLPGGNLVHDVAVSRRRIRGITFSNDGQQIIVAGEDRLIRVLDAARCTELFRLAAGPAKVLALVAYAPGRLATAGSDNQIHLWDLNARRKVARLSGHSGSVAALDAMGEVLVSGSYDTTVRIWPVGRSVEGDNRAERLPSGTIR